jgi:NADH:ubiquinone oxidoreductase subunit 6 (subunit J)
VYMLDKLRASGASQAEISKQALEMAKMSEMYKNPLFNILLTYVEIVPVGLVVSLISALVLKRKTPKQQVPAFS